MNLRDTSPELPCQAHVSDGDAEFARRLVLLVEDDPQVRDMLSEMLRRARFSVCAVGDGAEAIKALRSRRFAVVVTDVVMPERDGLELLRWIRTSPRPIRVVAISGNGPDDGELYSKAAVSMGAETCLPKPVDRMRLIAAIDRAIALDGHAASESRF